MIRQSAVSRRIMEGKSWHSGHPGAAVTAKAKAVSYCYIHKGNARRGVDTDKIVRSERFNAPLEKKANDEWKMKSGQIVYVCFTSDFFVEDADPWRAGGLADHPSAS